MSRINKANLKKTIYYLKRNGIKKTFYAVRERLQEKRRPPYIWTPPSATELDAQRTRWKEKDFTVTFSILVPTYRTKPEYLTELIDSLRRQTYPKWELILADATEDDSVELVIRDLLASDTAFSRESASDAPVSDHSPSGSQAMEGPARCETDSGDIVSDIPASCNSASKVQASDSFIMDSLAFGYPDSRIRYVHLEQNAGIAENTNQALPYATGDYVGLLDHDDILTENALYEMAAAIETGERQGTRPRMLYSDEDKCNGDRTQYYEPNFKEDFNLDLLLSNNYICHFLVMDRELMQKLKFRREYDGAQDHDLVLRAAAQLSGVTESLAQSPQTLSLFPEKDGTIIHIPKVLYHWRCHTGSTAENPQSKLYAYEAGRRAIQDFADRAGWQAKAVNTAHVGFYRLQYTGSPFDCRSDIGAIGGRVTGKSSGCKSTLRGMAQGNEAKPVYGKTTEDIRAWQGYAADNKPKVEKRAAGSIPSGKQHTIGGRMTETGTILYKNLPASYSGYLHRAILPQDGAAVDIRNIQIRPECQELFQKVTGVPYKTASGENRFDTSLLPANCDYIKISLKLCRALQEAGYRILYLPEQD